MVNLLPAPKTTSNSSHISVKIAINAGEYAALWVKIPRQLSLIWQLLTGFSRLTYMYMYIRENLYGTERNRRTYFVVLLS